MIGLGVNALAGGAARPKIPTASFLSHFDGTDGSTTITDEYGNTCTAQGDAQIDTAQSQFGGASLLLDSSGDYVDVASFANKVPGSSDWLLECFVRSNDSGVPRTMASVRADLAVTGGGYVFTIGATGFVGFVAWDATSTLLMNFNSGATIAASTWHHLGVLKIGTTYGVLVDGVVMNTATTSGTVGSAGSAPLRWGRDVGNTVRDWNGWIDEGRIVSGTEVAGIYPNALTSLVYTVPTAPFEKG